MGSNNSNIYYPLSRITQNGALETCYILVEGVGGRIAQWTEIGFLLQLLHNFAQAI